jgi:hypothetical protein
VTVLTPATLPVSGRSDGDAPATCRVPVTVPARGFVPAALTLSVPVTVDTPATDPLSGAVTVRRL